MVPNGSAYANYPSFANNGTKTPPGGSTESAKYALGMVPADTFPAEWANYLFHGATAGITRLNQDTGSIKKELNSILAAYNIENDASSFSQLLQVFYKLYPQVASCDTGAQTEVKSVAVQGDVQHTGTIYVIEMTNGNTYGDGSTTYPKISINSGTAYPICDAGGNYVGSGAWNAGETITVLFTGSKFLMSTRSVTDAVTDGDMRPVTSNAVHDYIPPKAGQWTTARSIKIQDADGTNTGSGVSVNGSADKTLKLPATIKATLTGNADSATSATSATNADKVDNFHVNNQAVNTTNASLDALITLASKAAGTRKGCLKFTNGLIIQWGSTAVNTSLATIDLTSDIYTSFTSTNSYTVFATREKTSDFSSGGGADKTPQFYKVSKSQFKLDCPSGAEVRSSWIAIGY